MVLLICKDKPHKYSNYRKKKPLATFWNSVSRTRRERLHGIGGQGVNEPSSELIDAGRPRAFTVKGLAARLRSGV